MPKRIRQVTRVIETSEVVFEGTLTTVTGGWLVNGEDIAPWLDRFCTKHVRLTIALLDQADDARLEGEEETDA